MTDVFDPYASDFDGLSEYRCSMVRQIGTVAGAMVLAGLAGFTITLKLVRKVLRW